MTLYYDSDLDAVVENHPDEWMYIDDDGHMVFDVSDPQKRDSLLSAVRSAKEEHERRKPDEGDAVTFVDMEGTEHDAVITKAWNERTINLAYADDDGLLTQASSVVKRDDDDHTYSWYTGEA